MDYLQLFGGAAMLYLGAEWLVGGASRLALALRIPSLVVGLTVVAYGTSAPEVVVSMQAAWTGHGAVALGNIIGSNIANIGLILGVSSLLLPARVPAGLRGRELPVLLLSALGLAWALADGSVSRIEAALLLGSALGYTAWTLSGAWRGQALRAAETGAEVSAEAASTAGAPEAQGRWRNAGVAAAGLGLLLLGGSLFVAAATSLALVWGMSERLVGLTIVAVGTSLPELMTSVIAALRGHSDIAVGNVLGSNIFNVLFCAGAAGSLRPLSGGGAALGVDLGVMLAFTLLAVALLRTERLLRRWEGGLLLGAYGIYLAVLAWG